MSELSGRDICVSPEGDVVLEDAGDDENMSEGRGIAVEGIKGGLKLGDEQTLGELAQENVDRGEDRLGGTSTWCGSTHMQRQMLLQYYSATSPFSSS